MTAVAINTLTTTTLSKQDVATIRSLLSYATEELGKVGTTEHMRLRAIEDKLGKLVGERFTLSAVEAA
jgi:hypothetical protein